MKDSQDSQLLKEQVRIKNSELKKLQAERNKQEEKVQFLQDFTQKRIKILQAKIEEQEEEIRYYQSRTTHTTKTSEADSTHAAAEVTADELAQKERYLKTLHFLKELKSKNDRLGVKLDHEKKERDRLTKEKGILAREIRRLRDNPDTTVSPAFRNEAHTIDTQLQEVRTRYEHLLKEKDVLISSYEAAIVAATESGEASPSAIKSLAQNLEALKEEKATLEKTLKQERKKHANILARRIELLEEEITQRMKRRLGRKKKFSGEEDEVNMGDGWITTYADLATLLMTFFILYYSIGQMNLKKVKDMVESGQSTQQLKKMIHEQQQPQALEEMTGLKKEKIMEDIKDLQQEVSKDSKIEVEADRNQIVLKLPGETLFPSGSADLDIKKSRKTLQEIVKVAKKYPKYKIQIKGHTDDVPIDSDKFPTNWELSAARATAVLRYFLDKNVSALRLTASGYADTFPLADNSSELGRKMNRRVEIVLEKEKQG